MSRTLCIWLGAEAEPWGCGPTLEDARRAAELAVRIYHRENGIQRPVQDALQGLLDGGVGVRIETTSDRYDLVWDWLDLHNVKEAKALDATKPTSTTE